MRGLKVGDKFTTRCCGDFVVLQLLPNHNVLIKFTQTGYTKSVRKGYIRDGAINDPYYPKTFGVGYLGENVDCTQRSYKVWLNMLLRCYSSDYQEKNPSYVGCSVCKEWHCYKTFDEWYAHQHIGRTELLEIDKDLLVRGNRQYSPQTCTFLPKAINMALQYNQDGRGDFGRGVYFHKKNNKYVAQITYGGEVTYLGSFHTCEEATAAYNTAKESYVRGLAEEYKDMITEQTYNALKQWSVH